MIQPATKIVDQEPAAPAGAIDLGQLARMTFGDRSLEREVLQLFDRQAAILIERMRGTNAAAIGALAHTLKGSAGSIGAAGVVYAAAAIEQAAGAGERDIAIDRFADAIDEVRAAIAGLLAHRGIAPPAE
jgi:HPt (histidine-containing phosphotransfer) domain-containing protein